MSSSSDIAVSVRGLSKMYAIAHNASDATTAAEALVRRFRAPMKKTTHEEFWALRDVTFDVQKGDVVGIIGRNGAGKSTLLKVLSRITEPTRGEAVLHGRLGSLLEVGTGFHPELTGRENIYLNGAILGMTRAEITRQFDAIVDFSGTEKFLDTPVKRYSSGMYVRLAFAVAAHLNPEVLIIDEVLAVGDTEFQKKCLGKMGEVAQSGRTVLFVSHNMAAVTRLCRSVVWMQSGTVKEYGKTDIVTDHYLGARLSSLMEWNRDPNKTKDSACSIDQIRLLDDNGNLTSVFGSKQSVNIEVVYTVHQPISSMQISARISNSEELPVFTTADTDITYAVASPRSVGTFRTRFRIPGGFLRPDKYTVMMAANLPMVHIFDLVDDSIVFEISDADSLIHLDARLGVVTPTLDWEVEAISDRTKF